MSECKTTVPVRLYPTPEQGALLRAHCQEYLSAINVLVQAVDSDVLPNGGKDASTKDFTAALPSAVKNQALRDARSIWNRSCQLGVMPVLRKPICQWNNQNWRIERGIEGDVLLIPVYQNGQVGQIAIRCRGTEPQGSPGILRIKRKRGKWVGDVAYTLPEPEATTAQGVMGIDLGVRVPAVVHVIGKGTRFLGNGRQQRAKRRQGYARRRELQQASKVRAVRKTHGTERRWLRDTNHKLSHAIVSHAPVQGVGIIRLERLAGIRSRVSQRTVRCTARKSRGVRGRTTAKARKNNRLIATWTFHQLATCIAYKAERAGIVVEWVDPAYTSQTCPACLRRNTVTDRRHVCVACGWTGHRDAVGAINTSRRTAEVVGTGRHGVREDSAGAAVAEALTADGPPETALGKPRFPRAVKW
jgi:IS605 OrfB family transposase